MYRKGYDKSGKVKRRYADVAFQDPMENDSPQPHASLMLGFLKMNLELGRGRSVRKPGEKHEIILAPRLPNNPEA